MTVTTILLIRVYFYFIRMIRTISSITRKTTILKYSDFRVIRALIDKRLLCPIGL
jgi:hypothetical protein